MAEELVPLFTAKVANAVVLVGQSIHPHKRIRRVLHADGHHVVGVVEAKLAQGITESCIQRSEPALRRTVVTTTHKQCQCGRGPGT